MERLEEINSIRYLRAGYCSDVGMEAQSELSSKGCRGFEGCVKEVRGNNRGKGGCCSNELSETKMRSYSARHNDK